MQFLNRIGIPTRLAELPADSFLPGLSIQEGRIDVDREALKYPGDILHEAGHIAVVPAADRRTLNTASIATRKDRDAEEMMAIAWSYAACLGIELAPCFVFHDDGYRGGGSYIADNFKEKKYFGLPMLQWIGLTADEANAASPGGRRVSAYAEMAAGLTPCVSGTRAGSSGVSGVTTARAVSGTRDATLRFPPVSARLPALWHGRR